MADSDSSRWWVASEAALVVSCFVLPWSFGGAPAWTTALLVALGFSALGLWVIGAVRNRRRWGLHPVLLVPLTLAAVAAAQLVPLPPSLLGLLSPPAEELREFALVPLGLTQWRPISMDPAATARALARALGMGAVLAATLELGRREGARSRLTMALALSGLSIAICGFGHLLADAEELFGTYGFQANLPLVTPFGNTNHLAAWLTLCGAAAGGLALATRTREQMLGWTAVAATCGLGVFLSYSRGGIGVLVTTWGLVGAAALSRRAGGVRAILPWLIIAGTLAFAALLSFEELAARASTVATLDRLQATKVELWPMLAAGAARFWPAGMGLGAFELGFGRFQTRQFGVTFTHPENLPLQYGSEVGLPLGLVVAALVLAAGVRAWPKVKDSPLERTLLIGVAGALLHDVFDFSLELNALGPAVALAAGVSCATSPSLAARASVRRLMPALLVALATVAVVALLAGRRSHLDAERQLQAAIRDGRSFLQTRALAVSLIDDHPADWVLYANAGSEAAAHGDSREALAWVNRTLFLRPGDAISHVAAARALLRLGVPLQALGELKLAWSLGDGSSLEFGLAVAARERAFERIVTDDPAMLDAQYELLRARQRAGDARELIRAAEQNPSEAVRGAARILAIRQEANFGDPGKALASLGELPAEQRERTELQQLEVGLLERLGKRPEAIRVLERIVAREPSNLGAAVQLATLLAKEQRSVAAHEVLARARPFASTPQARVAVLQQEANLWLQEERLPRALEALTTASRIEPSRADLHYRLAEVLEHLGSINSALEEVRKGRLLDTPGGAQAQDGWVRRLERAQVQ